MAKRERAVAATILATAGYAFVAGMLFAFEGKAQHGARAQGMENLFDSVMFALHLAAAMWWLQRLLPLAGGATYDIARVATADLHPMFTRVAGVVQVGLLTANRTLLQAIAMLQQTASSDRRFRSIVGLWAASKAKKNLVVYVVLLAAFAVNIAFATRTPAIAFVANGAVVVILFIATAISEAMLALRLRKALFGTRRSESLELVRFMLSRAETIDFGDFDGAAPGFPQPNEIELSWTLPRPSVSQT